jgi:signal transduction histidine kinase
MDTKLLYITIIIAVLIAIIIIYFFASIVQYHRRYVKLQRERLDAEITIQENERKRIANDLHDSFGPILAAVKININCIKTDSPEDVAVIEKSSRYIDEIITNLRRISYNLLPNTLERKGLLEALKEYIGNLQDKHHLHFEFTTTGQIMMPMEKGIHIFRMLQEIIHNTIKHAKAKNIQITMSEKKGMLYIKTQDDGVGFDENAVATESSGLGLKSIKSRVELLNGRLTLKTSPQKGTVYFMEIPV